MDIYSCVFYNPSVIAKLIESTDRIPDSPSKRRQNARNGLPSYLQPGRKRQWDSIEQSTTPFCDSLVTPSFFHNDGTAPSPEFDFETELSVALSNSASKAMEFDIDFDFSSLYTLPEMEQSGLVTAFPSPSSELLDDEDENPVLPVSAPTCLLTEAESLRLLYDQSHETRIALKNAVDADKGTSTAYERHIRRFKLWWSMDQDRRLREDQRLTRVTSEPVTATKVAIWLAYEATRPKASHHLFTLRPISKL